ncbi:glial cell line-derived neurotrophic factor-like [Scleropages formosus]|uniref:Glial cell line-derived neurotrophic factor n=1 Tax=Scleropages formosus TaxID=113540 RepID=A0A0P7UUE5_SCLFO|nr:glial cell line-derived neurotrophic factor [Scleropages formosus]KPP78068.1 glial cell line-derived neurotrophic factor-like [Scleropages formosus]
MKLWDVLALCVSLSAVSTSPLFPRLAAAPAKRHHFLEQVLDSPLLHVEESAVGEEDRLENQWQNQEDLPELSIKELYTTSPSYPGQQEDVMSLIQTTISRMRRALQQDVSSRARTERGRQRDAASRDRKGRGRGEKRRGRSRGVKPRRNQSHGCVLKQVHLNVTDLGLGYWTKEELIFRYCSGPCIDSETNYDKILNNLTHNKKLDQDKPARTCCRPIAFDDDLSFLDDNLVYHTLKKHSARKCGCV